MKQHLNKSSNSCFFWLDLKVMLTRRRYWIHWWPVKIYAGCWCSKLKHLLLSASPPTTGFSESTQAARSYALRAMSCETKRKLQALSCKLQNRLPVIELWDEPRWHGDTEKSRRSSSCPFIFKFAFLLLAITLINPVERINTIAERNKIILRGYEASQSRTM